MTQPRMWLPGATYLVTRTCAERRFLLVPDAVLNEAFAFCLARAQRAHPDVEVHAVSVQTNHYHAVVTDHRGGGDLSDFMHALNTLFARFVQAYRKDDAPGKTLERVWARRSFSAVALTHEDAVLFALGYTLTNPVKDLQVADYRKWPGFHTKPRHWMQDDRVVKRPGVYFDQSDPDLEQLPLRLSPPPMLRSGRDLADATQHVEDYVLSEQRRLVSEHVANGKVFAGVKAVRALDPFSQPGRPLRKSTLDPQLAAGGHSEVLRRAKKLLRDFRAAYREAWKCFKAGVAAVFPFGTMTMHRRFGVEVAPPFEAPWCMAGGSS